MMLINRNIKKYSFRDAINIIKKKIINFNESIDVNIHFNKIIKDTNNFKKNYVILPNIIKNIKIGLLFNKKDNYKKYKYNLKDIDFFISNKIIKKKIFKKIPFDILIISENDLNLMKKSEIKFLSKKKIILNNKYGTLFNNLNEIINKIKSGQVKYNFFYNNILNITIGKIFFEYYKLEENFISLINQLYLDKPSYLSNKKLFNKIIISSTMSNGIEINCNNII